MSCSILVVNRGTVSPTQHYLLFIVKFLGIIFTVLQLLSLTKGSFILFSIIHDNISSQVSDKRRWGYSQWINSLIIHDSILKLIHKNCHPKSYHSDIKCHMTLNIMFNVELTYLRVNSTIWYGNPHLFRNNTIYN